MGTLGRVTVGKIVLSNGDRYSLTGLGAFYRSKHHRQALDIVCTTCLGWYTLGNVPQKLRHHAEMPARLTRVRLFGRDETLAFVKKSFGFRHIFTSNIVQPVPTDRSLR